MDTTKDPNGTRSSLQDYKLDERRTSNYTFTSMKGLVRYFSNWLDEEDIEEIVDAAKIGFVNRAGISNEETKLQLIKKCEYTLVRTLRKSNYN